MSANWLLDTNVLSELIRPKPDEGVVAWIASRPPEALYVSAITKAEMLFGVRLLPTGKRQRDLDVVLHGIFSQDFADRVLPFDTRTAEDYADIVAHRRREGRPISQFDAQIASIARQRGMVLVTRNTTDFEACGLVLVDPWTAAVR